MLGKTLRSSSLVLVATLALALGGASAMPSPSVAVPNNGGGTSESDVCNSLLERLKRYHTISKNRNETKAVREFYAAQAQLTLLQGKRNNCQWAAQALVSGQGTVAVDAVDGITATRASKRFTRRAARLAGDQTGPRPETTATLAKIKAQPTGDSQQDEYCRGVADLIDDAYSQGDQAFISGDEEGAQAWYDLAAEFTDRATQNGCRFTLAVRRAHGILQRHAVVIAARP
jgi:hypothetical protein